MTTTAQKIDRLQRLERIAALTAYDYPTARIIDEAGIDLILVGDSVGMVFAGYPNTTHVTMQHMVYHTEVVARAVKRALLVADLPYHTYRTPEETLHHAGLLLQAGAEAVKLEGGEPVLPQVRALTSAGVPVVGHLGMLPQSILEEKGYKKKGKTPEEAARLLQDARSLEAEGALALVLEGMVPGVAARVTEAVQIPTIGIGAGPGCRGEIAVIHDVIGAFPWFCPPFARPRADVAGTVSRAVREYAAAAQQIRPPR